MEERRTLASQERQALAARRARERASVTTRPRRFAGFTGPGRRRVGQDPPPVALALDGHEISGLRQAVEAYSTF